MKVESKEGFFLLTRGQQKATETNHFFVHFITYSMANIQLTQASEAAFATLKNIEDDIENVEEEPAETPVRNTEMEENPASNGHFPAASSEESSKMVLE